MKESKVLENEQNYTCKKQKTLSALQLAIKNNDDEYISTFIEKYNHTGNFLKNLNKIEKCALAKMIVEFINGENKMNAVKILHIIVNDIGCVNDVAKALLSVQVDIKKLMFLKGKIEYLIHKNKTKKDEESTNIIDVE